MARLVSGRLPQPNRVRRRLPGRLTVFTPVTLTLKAASTAWRIWVLCVPGATTKVYLPSSASLSSSRDHRAQQNVPRV